MVINMENSGKIERSAGILMHISSLPSPFGIGTFGKTAYEFVDFVAQARHRYWQVLPLGPTTYGDSPYQSYSAFAGNPYFVDLEMLTDDGILDRNIYEDIDWGSGDYVRTVQLNWELELPASEGCLYETDSGASFSGDGERYHVLAYADDSGLEETLTEEATPVRSAEVPVTEILDLLAVPADQRPDFSDCRGFTAAHPTDERNRLYLLVNSAGTRLYVVECFF